MSVRAYRVIKKELAEIPSFNLWHDTEILEYFQKTHGFFEAMGDFGAGKLEVSTDSLKNLLAEYPWKSEDYRKKAITADLAWAEENREEYVEYDCY